jgi:hypothetical protein
MINFILTGKTTPTNRTAQSKIGSLDNSKHTQQKMKAEIFAFILI